MERKQHKMRQAVVSAVLAFSLAFSMTVPAFAAFSAEDKAAVEAKLAELRAEAEKYADYVAEHQDEWIATGLEWAEYVEENYEEWYAEGFKYADENGYIAAAKDGLVAALAALEGVDIDATEATDDFRDDFKAAVAAVKALEEAVDKLAEPTGVFADDLALAQKLAPEALDALYAALAAAEQAGIDVNELVIIPALNEALEYLNDVVIPELQAAAEDFVEVAAEWLAEQAELAYAEFLAALEAAIPAADKALYDWFYNNPDKVCGFFAEYGDVFCALFECHGEAILGVLGYIACEYGDDAVEYVLANPEECLCALVNWYETYGDRVWAMIDVYMDYLGVYDAVEAQLAALEAELEALLEQAAAEADAALKAEIEKQIAVIEAQIAEIEAALAELEAAILAFQADVEAQIEAVKALADALKADVEELAALLEQIATDAEAALAAAQAVCDELAKLEWLTAFAEQAYVEFMAFLKDVAPEVDAALYDWFYNNPDKVCAFLAEYGDEMLEHSDAVLAILGYIACEFGDEALEYVIANPEQCLDAMVAWYETYGDRVWAMIDVYFDYLGVYDAVEAQIAELEAELACLKACLEAAAGDMDAAVKAEIEKQIAVIEAQIAELEAALAELEAAILAFQADVEAQIEALVAQIEKQIAELKAAIEALEAMAQELNAEIQAAIAELKAAVEALEAAVEALIEDATQAAEAIEAFFQQIVELLGEFYAEAKGLTEAALADAVHGEWGVNASKYVALGDATIAGDDSYADQLAAFVAELAAAAGTETSFEKVVVADEADLVANTADILAAVEAGELDEVLAEAGLVTVSAGAEDLTVSIVYQLVEVLSAYAMASLNEAAVCDWAAYAGVDGAAAVEAALAQIEAALAEQLGDEAAAAMATDLIEAVAFGYVGFAVNYVELLDAVQVAAPNANIIAVGLANVLEGLTFDVNGFELALGEYAGWVVKAADLEMLAYAALDEGGNVTFVSAQNAACDAAAVIAEIVEVAMAIDFENDPEAVLEILPLVAQIADTATWMPNAEGQAYIAEQILGAVDFVAVADAVYTAAPAEPAAFVAVDGVVTETVAASEAVEVTDEAIAVVALEDGCAVEATFAIEHLATVESFEDFEAGAWYLEEGQGSFAELRTLYMDYALATGLMSGYADSNLFGAWDSLDRAQAATVIYRMAVEDASATLVPELYADNATEMADVEDGMYYTAAVNWCVENEIITGYQAGPNAGKFKPYNKVTRSELAAMIQRYCVKVCGVEMIEADVMGYEDSGLIDTTWALPGLQFCKAYGIMTGVYGKNELNPVGKANRAEAAKMFSVVGHDIL